jgi:putative hemolysin
MKRWARIIHAMAPVCMGVLGGLPGAQLAPDRCLGQTLRRHLPACRSPDQAANGLSSLCSFPAMRLSRFGLRLPANAGRLCPDYSADMLALERRLQDLHPTWFRGGRARLTRPVLRAFGRWSRLQDVEDFLAANASLRDFDFVRAALRYLDVDYAIDEAALGAIPSVGRLLIVANHPSGALDALALLDAVGRVRPDAKIVANDMLCLLEPIRNLLLPVRVFGGHAGRESLRAIERALEAEQCVIVFPAGEVSRLRPDGVRDPRWRQGVVHFARKTSAPVLPVRIDARNSALFYGASALYKPAASALLAREMFARSGWAPPFCTRPPL